ncbi:MAG: DNA mismatch repair protein MutS [Phycisphaeraceae bacterium]
MAKGDANHTPAMRQFHRFKKQHPDCVLFFRMGDFYEMFHDDAKLAHKVLGVTLTQRTKGIPMAGVPYHAVENYLRRMIQAGYRVAVCDQVEDPAQAKGVVKRDVTRVITPGTLTDESLLDEGRENPLAAVMFHADDRASLAWVELSTGSFSLTTLHADELTDELARVAPSELLYCETADGQTPQRVQRLADATGCALAARPAWQFRQDEAVQMLCKQFRVAELAGFGLQADDPALGAASAAVHYLFETQKTAAGHDQARLAHLQPPRRFCRSDHLVIDQTTLRSLEVAQTIRSAGTEGSLLGVLQDCKTAMGKRTLRQWLFYPLCDRQAIETRQRVVAALVEDGRFVRDLRDTLNDVQDIERIMGRLAVGRAAPRDLVALGRSAKQAQRLADLLADRPAVHSYHHRIKKAAATLQDFAQQIDAACIESPPNHLREGGLIKDGYDRQLDEYRHLQRDSHSWLARYQKQLIDQTGVTSLKIGYNKVFGYYIGLTAANKNRAPDDWTRKQTLKNAERFITPQLKEFEGNVLSAEHRAVSREQVLFARLCDTAQQYLQELRTFARVVAEMDVLACFARRAARYHYVQPTMVDEPVLHIEAGRHPVLDELLGDQFVPNDVALGSKVQSPEPEVAQSDSAGATLDIGPGTSDSQATLALITGPNMSGKSTYIRQTALIVLLAHTGSFVPAAQATIGLCDRIFTRVGASDELHAGRSTFMVEMTETANICHHVTPASLVILDEIGRGTSTLDGLSLAWAITEFLAHKRCRTLFATHYHELTGLSEQHENVANLNVTVREWGDQIVFLHRIVPGATDRSYGIHVAKIAGLPDAVVQRATKLLGQLEVSHQAPTGARPLADSPANTGQLPLFTEYLPHPAINELRHMDLNSLTPLQAFDLLRKLREHIDNNSG